MKALIVAALVVTGAPVIAMASAQEGVTVEAPKQVCRRMEVPMSGSRISRRRVCTTAEQWRARAASGDGATTDDAEGMLDVIGRANPAYRSPNGFSGGGGPR
jgi:hypothetical protein